MENGGWIIIAIREMWDPSIPVNPVWEAPWSVRPLWAKS